MVTDAAVKEIKGPRFRAPGALFRLKTSLERDLGLTCQLAEKGFGEYSIWDCEGVSIRVSLYSRKSAPEKVDFLGLTFNPDENPDLLAKLVKIALPQVDALQVQDWVSKTAPVVASEKKTVETVMDGIPFALSLSYGDRFHLQMGEPQNFK